MKQANKKKKLFPALNIFILQSGAKMEKVVKTNKQQNAIFEDVRKINLESSTKIKHKVVYFWETQEIK